MSIKIGDLISVGKAKRQAEVIAISADKTRIGVKIIGGGTRDIANPDLETAKSAEPVAKPTPPAPAPAPEIKPPSAVPAPEGPSN